ncbi:MAG: DUF4384 domain-containing protein [Bryobacteraceae bacterium]|jgi:Domain of unknown function (DUF4384)
MIDKDKDAGFVFYLALLPIVAALVLAPRLEPQPISQSLESTLNARDLYYEKSAPPPGLKWRILLRDAQGAYRSTSIDSLFQNNDRVRLEVESNTAGFLYLLQEGSDSTWDILFPSSEIRDNDNHLEPGRPVRIPRDQDFAFDQTPGQESLFVVLSPNQEPDLERLLNLVRSQDGKIAQKEEAPSLFKTISTEINAGLASRNLKVYQSSGADAPHDAQNAVYAVNTNLHEGRIISKLLLNHKRE